MSKAFDGIFPIGLGTSRLPFSNQGDVRSEFENAVNLALYAIDQGVNYIDTATGYSGNRAISVVGEAIRRTDREICTTVKIMLKGGKPGDGSYYRAALSILEVGSSASVPFLAVVADEPGRTSPCHREGWVI